MFSRHPVDNPRITYGFGAGGDKWANKHQGVDYGGYEGQPIYAPADGFIVWARSGVAAAGNPWEQIPGSGNNGNCVIINHGPSDWATHTLYAHLSAITAKEGQHVKAGQIIGHMGNTGYSFGTHLHWEMFIDYSEGQYPAGTFYGRVNPLDYFDVATVTPVAPGAGGGSGTTKPSKEPFTVSQYAEITKKLDRAIAIATENQRRINKLPDAFLDADYTLEGSEKGKRSTVRNRFAWLPHEQHRVANDVLAVKEELAELRELLTTPKEEV